MPDFWQFPTVSMGLAPINSIYQARFMRYLENRGLIPKTGRAKVWAFLGDGEMDEPESLGAITLASREKLDNLIFVVNCNLQRLDGPVRGNGKIIQELEGLFRGAGWNVIKVIWGSDWDRLFAEDTSGRLLLKLHERMRGRRVSDVQGQRRRIRAQGILRQVSGDCEAGGGYERRAARRASPRRPRSRKGLQRLSSAPWSTKAQPTVILAKTVKGYGLGEAGEGRNHHPPAKEAERKELIEYFRDSF